MAGKDYKLGIIEAIEGYLTTLSDDELLCIGMEMNNDHDSDCDWAWRISIDEEFYSRAESALYDRSVKSIVKAMKWAQKAIDCDYVDWDGNFATEADFLERARDNVSEIASVIANDLSDYCGGRPYTSYRDLDEDELMEALRKSDEWQEEYGENEDEED